MHGQGRGSFQPVLFELPSPGKLMFPPTTYLVGCTALIWTKHDGVRSVILEPCCFKLPTGEKFEIGTSAAQPLTQFQLKLESEALCNLQRLIERGCYSVMSSLLRYLRASTAVRTSVGYPVCTRFPVGLGQLLCASHNTAEVKLYVSAKIKTRYRE